MAVWGVHDNDRVGGRTAQRPQFQAKSIHQQLRDHLTTWMRAASRTDQLLQQVAHARAPQPDSPWRQAHDDRGRDLRHQ